MSQEKDTYEQNHPKSATLRRQSKSPNKRSHVSNFLITSQEPLHSIREEHRLLEESQRQNRSHSELRNRPDTPEFTLVEEGDSDDNLEQGERIRAQMVAQIVDDAD